MPTPTASKSITKELPAARLPTFRLPDGCQYFTYRKAVVLSTAVAALYKRYQLYVLRRAIRGFEPLRCVYG